MEWDLVASGRRSVHDDVMITVIRRYWSFLTQGAQTNAGGGRLIDLKLQMLPWFAPLLLGGMICAVFDAGENARRIILAPALVITLAGMGFVGSAYTQAASHLNCDEDKHVSDEEAGKS